jgi:hypothetical protein
MDDAMQMFYKLKGIYQKEVDKKKYKIMHTDGLSMSEKRDLFLSQKFKCVNCKRSVNTIFNIEGNRLKAVCGASVASTSETPCSLNIDIVKGNTRLLSSYTEELQKKHKEFIDKIMKVKYNLLFSQITEDKAIEEFEKQKNEYDENATLYNIMHTKLLTVTELLNKQEEIDLTDLQIFEIIKEMNRMIEDGITTSNSQFFKDSIELYIHKLLGVLKNNNELKYSYQNIEKQENDTFRLVQKPYILSDLEITVGNGGKVESLVMGKK